MFKMGDDRRSMRKNLPLFISEGNHVCDVTMSFLSGRGNSCGYRVQVFGVCH